MMGHHRLHPLITGILLICLVSLSGCKTVARTIGNPIIAHNHQAAQSLIRVAGAQLDVSDRMLATIFTSAENPAVTSSFGRIASRQLVSAFSAEGYHFSELPVPDTILVAHNHGDPQLTPTFTDTSAGFSADVVLVGTYAIAERNIYVTTRLIRTRDSLILASHDYALPYTSDLRRLLRPERW